MDEGNNLLNFWGEKGKEKLIVPARTELMFTTRATHAIRKHAHPYCSAVYILSSHVGFFFPFFFFFQSSWEREQKTAARSCGHCEDRVPRYTGRQVVLRSCHYRCCDDTLLKRR